MIDENGKFDRRWVGPFYLKFMHGNFVHLTGQKKTDFISRVNKTLTEIDQSVINRMYAVPNWRHRLTASWFCGLKGWRGYTGVIADQLRPTWDSLANLGHAFALASFADQESIECLKWATNTWILTDLGDNLHWCYGALGWVDSNLGTNHLSSYKERLLYKCGDRNPGANLEDEFEFIMDYCRANFISPEAKGPS